MAQDRWAEGLAQVRALRDLPPHRLAEKESDAFEAVRKGVIAIKKEMDILDACPAEEQVGVMSLLVKRGLERKTLKARATACLATLLERPVWRKVLHDNPDLLGSMKELVADTPDLSALLEGPAPTEAEMVRVDGPADDAPPTEDMIVKEKNIRASLAKGLACMRSFGWEFPHDPMSSRSDDAAEGFQSFFDGLTWLSTPVGRRSIGSGLPALVEEIEGDSADILQFLISMYEHPSRKSWRARIKFAIGQLSELSPTFKAAVDDRESMPIASFKRDSGLNLAPVEAPTAPTEESKPVVMWIDYKSSAYETSSLNVEEGIEFVGFHDDPAAPDYTPPEKWLQYAIERASIPDGRVIAMILNRAHLETAKQILDYYDQEGCEPPKVVVCTRAPPEEFSEWGIPADCITKDWEAAARIVMGATSRRPK